MGGSPLSAADCDSTLDVGGGQTYATIQAAVNAVPASLTGNVCVVLRDVGPFAEQVSVFNKASGGFRLSIAADGALASQPVVNPPALSTAAFWVASASVTLHNIRVQPANAVSYGVWASSAFVTVSSINVDSNGFIGVAGISLSSFAFVLNSSVTAVDAHALYIGGAGNVVSRSSANYIYAAGPTRYPLFLDGASSNTFSMSLASASASSPRGSRFLAASHNLVAASTFSANAAALELAGSSWNVIANSLVAGTAGALLELTTSFANLFSDVRLIGAETPGGVQVAASSSNTFSGAQISLVSTLAGSQGVLLSRSHWNSILRSTIAVDGVTANSAALKLDSSSGNIVASSLITLRRGISGTPPTVEIDDSSAFNLVAFSSIATPSPTSTTYALFLRGSSNTVTDSGITAAGSGAPFYLYASNSLIQRSTVTTTHTIEAAQINGSSNVVRDSYFQGKGTALDINGVRNTISRSTAVTTGAFAVTVNAGAANTMLSEVRSLSGTTNGINVSAAHATVSSCTIQSSGAASNALVLSGSSPTVTDSIITGTANGINTIAPNTVIARSTVTTTSGASPALALNAQSGHVSDSYFYGSVGGIWVGGGRFNTISRSTAVSNSGAAILFTANADSNTVTQSLLTTPFATALTFQSGCESNIIMLSTLTSDNSTVAAVAIDASSNTILLSYIRNASGIGIRTTSTLATIAESTISVNGASFPALQFSGGSSNTVTRSRLTNLRSSGDLVGEVAWFSGATRHNVASYNSFEGDGSTYTVSFQSSSTFNSFIDNDVVSAGLHAVGILGNSNANLLSGNRLSITLGAPASAPTASAALIIQSSTGNLVTQSVIRTPFARALAITERSKANTVSLSTLTAASGTGIVINGLGSMLTSSNTISQCYVQGSTVVNMLNAFNTVLDSNILVSTAPGGIGATFGITNNSPSLGLTMTGNSIRAGPEGWGVRIDSGNFGAISLTSNVWTGPTRVGIDIDAQNAGAQVFIASNTILAAASASTETYGIRIVNLIRGATIQDNAIVYRDSGSMGAYVAYGLFVRGASGLLVRNNRISQPGKITAGGYRAVLLDGVHGSELRLNDFYGTGSGLSEAYLLSLLGSSDGVQVRGNAFVSGFSAAGASATLTVAGDSQTGFVSNYNDFFSENAANTGSWGGTDYAFLAGWRAGTGQDANSLAADPLWKSSATEDFHPLSTAGRFSPATADYVIDLVHSPLIDAADPAEGFGREPPYAGGRANMGSYGDAPQASKSAAPSTLGRPGTPSGTVLGRSSITWTWSAASGAASYRVYRASSPSTLLATPASPPFVDAGLATGTAYGIWVAPVNADGEGIISSAAVFTWAAPPAGGAVSAVGTASAAYSWSLNGNPAGTLAEIRLSTNGVDFSDAGTARISSATISGLSACTLYFLKVRHKNGDGIPTDFDPSALFTTAGSTPLPAPGLSARTLEGGRVGLSWTPSPSEGVSGYNVYSDAGTGVLNYAAPLGFSSGSEYTTTVLASSAAYRFAVRAKNRCGIEETAGAAASAASASGLSALRATLTAPEAGKRVWGNRVTVAAEITAGALDQVGRVAFQYKSTSSAAWADIPAAGNHASPDTKAPYFVHFDVTGLAAGDYDLRAVAVDLQESSDTYPAQIVVTVAPAAPDFTESLSAGRVEKRLTLSNAASNTLRTGGSAAGDPVVRLTLPAGALASPTPVVTVVSNPDLTTAAPAGFAFTGAAAQITLSNGQTSLSGGQSATISLTYPETVTDPTKLRLFSFDDATGRWTADLAFTVDADSRVITGTTSHFSFFAALVGTPAGTTDMVRVYPVPYKPFGGDPDQGKPFSASDPTSGILFDLVPVEATIRIYTLSGRLVAKVETAQSNGTIRWDARTDDGRDAASGGYVAVISAPGQKPAVRKLVIIR